MRILKLELFRTFSKSSYVFINPTVGLCVQLPNCPSHFIENLILPFDKSKDNTHTILPHLFALPSTLSEAHSCHPLISLLCPLRATTSLSMVKVTLVFVIRRIFFLFFFSSSSIYLFLNFIYVYIWSQKNILKVEFLINKTPSNTNLLPKTTKYHQRFWNICWKIFRFMHALFVLANDLFVLVWVLKKFVDTCFVFFFSFVDALSLHVLYISIFKSPFNLWQKIIQPPFLC